MTLPESFAPALVAGFFCPEGGGLDARGWLLFQAQDRRTFLGLDLQIAPYTARVGARLRAMLLFLSLGISLRRFERRAFLGPTDSLRLARRVTFSCLAKRK